MDNEEWIKEIDNEEWIKIIDDAIDKFVILIEMAK